MIAGSFGPWYTTLFGSVSGVDGRELPAWRNGWAVVVLAVVGGVMPWVGRNRPLLPGVVAMSAGSVGVCITLYTRSLIHDAADRLCFGCAHPSVGWGLTIATAGSLALAFAGLVLLAVHAVRGTTRPHRPRVTI